TLFLYIYKIVMRIMSTNVSDVIGLDIRSIRQHHNYTLKEFCSLFDVEEFDLKKLERGLVKPDTKLIKSIARYFKLHQKNIIAAQEQLLAVKTVGEGYVTSLQNYNHILPRRKDLRGKIPVLDLFCGIGGFSHGFELTNKFEVVAGIDLLTDRIDTFHA